MSIVAHGDPRALAKWAYKSLRSKQWGVLHVLVVGDGTAQLRNMRRVGAKKADLLQRCFPFAATNAMGWLRRASIAR